MTGRGDPLFSSEVLDERIRMTRSTLHNNNNNNGDVVVGSVGGGGGKDGWTSYCTPPLHSSSAADGAGEEKRNLSPLSGTTRKEGGREETAAVVSVPSSGVCGRCSSSCSNAGFASSLDGQHHSGWNEGGCGGGCSCGIIPPIVKGASRAMPCAQYFTVESKLFDPPRKAHTTIPTIFTTAATTTTPPPSPFPPCCTSSSSSITTPITGLTFNPPSGCSSSCSALSSFASASPPPSEFSCSPSSSLSLSSIPFTIHFEPIHASPLLSPSSTCTSIAGSSGSSHPHNRMSNHHNGGAGGGTSYYFPSSSSPSLMTSQTSRRAALPRGEGPHGAQHHHASRDTNDDHHNTHSSLRFLLPPQNNRNDNNNMLVRPNDKEIIGYFLFLSTEYRLIRHDVQLVKRRRTRRNNIIDSDLPKRKENEKEEAIGSAAAGAEAGGSEVVVEEDGENDKKEDWEEKHPSQRPSPAGKSVSFSLPCGMIIRSKKKNENNMEVEVGKEEHKNNAPSPCTTTGPSSGSRDPPLHPLPFSSPLPPSSSCSTSPAMVTGVGPLESGGKLMMRRIVRRGTAQKNEEGGAVGGVMGVDGEGTPLPGTSPAPTAAAGGGSGLVTPLTTSSVGGPPIVQPLCRGGLLRRSRPPLPTSACSSSNVNTSSSSSATMESRRTSSSNLAAEKEEEEEKKEKNDLPPLYKKVEPPLTSPPQERNRGLTMIDKQKRKRKKKELFEGGEEQQQQQQNLEQEDVVEEAMESFSTMVVTVGLRLPPCGLYFHYFCAHPEVLVPLFRRCFEYARQAVPIFFLYFKYQHQQEALLSLSLRSSSSFTLSTSSLTQPPPLSSLMGEKEGKGEEGGKNTDNVENVARAKEPPEEEKEGKLVSAPLSQDQRSGKCLPQGRGGSPRRGGMVALPSFSIPINNSPSPSTSSSCVGSASLVPQPPPPLPSTTIFSKYISSDRRFLNSRTFLEKMDITTTMWKESKEYLQHVCGDVTPLSFLFSPHSLPQKMEKDGEAPAPEEISREERKGTLRAGTPNARVEEYKMMLELWKTDATFLARVLTGLLESVKDREVRSRREEEREREKRTSTATAATTETSRKSPKEREVSLRNECGKREVKEANTEKIPSFILFFLRQQEKAFQRRNQERKNEAEAKQKHMEKKGEEEGESISTYTSTTSRGNAVERCTTPIVPSSSSTLIRTSPALPSSPAPPPPQTPFPSPSPAFPSCNQPPFSPFVSAAPPSPPLFPSFSSSFSSLSFQGERNLQTAIASLLFSSSSTAVSSPIRRTTTTTTAATRPTTPEEEGGIVMRRMSLPQEKQEDSSSLPLREDEIQSECSLCTSDLPLGDVVFSPLHTRRPPSVIHLSKKKEQEGEEVEKERKSEVSLPISPSSFSSPLLFHSPHQQRIILFTPSPIRAKHWTTLMRNFLPQIKRRRGREGSVFCCDKYIYRKPQNQHRKEQSTWGEECFSSFFPPCCCCCGYCGNDDGCCCWNDDENASFRRAFKTDVAYVNKSGLPPGLPSSSLPPSFRCDRSCDGGGGDAIFHQTGASDSLRFPFSDFELPSSHTEGKWKDCGAHLQWIPAMYEEYKMKYLVSSFTDEASLLVVCPEKKICFCLPIHRQLGQQSLRQHIYLSSRSSFGVPPPPLPVAPFPSSSRREGDGGGAPFPSPISDRSNEEASSSPRERTRANGANGCMATTTSQRSSTALGGSGSSGARIGIPPPLSPASLKIFSCEAVCPHSVTPNLMIQYVMEDVMRRMMVYLPPGVEHPSSSSAFSSPSPPPRIPFCFFPTFFSLFWDSFTRLQQYARLMMPRALLLCSNAEDKEGTEEVNIEGEKKERGSGGEEEEPLESNEEKEKEHNDNHHNNGNEYKEQPGIRKEWMEEDEEKEETPSSPSRHPCPSPSVSPSPPPSSPRVGREGAHDNQHREEKGRRKDGTVNNNQTNNNNHNINQKYPSRSPCYEFDRISSTSGSGARGRRRSISSTTSTSSSSMGSFYPSRWWSRFAHYFLLSSTLRGKPSASVGYPRGRRESGGSPP